MSMLKEFREFAMRGNVVDLAVGVIIGAAFGKIVDSVVGDLVMRHSDHAGVGCLELFDDRQRLASWRFTLRHNPQALLLQDLLNLRCSGQGGTTTVPEETMLDEDMA